MSGPALVKVDADKAEALRKWAVENGYGPGAKAKASPRPKVEVVEAPPVQEPEAPSAPVVPVEPPTTWRIDVGDCVSLMRGLPDSSVDAVVTDPPYEIGFMGKSWDSTGVAYDPKTWAECLRVLKPGGHLLAFAATRTYHRIAVAVEDAGFEIRDMVEWIYGTGFPKSLDVSKAITATQTLGSSSRRANRQAMTGDDSRSESFGSAGEERSMLTARSTPPPVANLTPDAQKWSGWGTALKPAHEPIVLARKPLAGTVAANVLEHGVGALNVDGCRVGAAGDKTPAPTRRNDSESWFTTSDATNLGGDDTKGRWPANLILGPDAAAELDESTGPLHPPGSNGQKNHDPSSWGLGNVEQHPSYSDKGGPSRFFYVAKPSRKERDAGLDGRPSEIIGGEGHALRGERNGEARTAKRKNTHPTVKPIALMRYLCRLVTPPDGIVVDPFAGSGTTGIGATLEGFRFLGFELDADHAEIARARITHWAEEAE